MNQSVDREQHESMPLKGIDTNHQKNGASVQKEEKEEIGVKPADTGSYTLPPIFRLL